MRDGGGLKKNQRPAGALPGHGQRGDVERRTHILHHLKANLWKPATHVVIVGCQGAGTLGRRLVEGDQFVRIFGEKIAVKAKIHTLGGFSAHAGQTDLLAWFNVIAPSRPRVVLTHGENGPRGILGNLTI